MIAMKLKNKYFMRTLLSLSIPMILQNLITSCLNMMDTAGIRDTEDVIEKMGVEKAKEYAKSADLVIYVVDASRSLDENDQKILNLVLDKKAIILLNKTDLETVVSKEMLAEQLLGREIPRYQQRKNWESRSWKRHWKKCF